MVGFIPGIGRRIDPALVVGDLAQDVPDATLPAQLRPGSAQLDASASGLGRGVDVFRGVDEIQDRFQVGEVTTPDRPVLYGRPSRRTPPPPRREAWPLGRGGRHPAERLAVIQSGQPGADQRDRSPVRFLGWARRLTRRWQLEQPIPGVEQSMPGAPAEGRRLTPDASMPSRTAVLLSLQAGSWTPGPCSGWRTCTRPPSIMTAANSIGGLAAVGGAINGRPL